MKNFFTFIRNNYDRIYRVFIFIAALGIIVYLLPKEAKFSYEYSIGRPWKYESLYADKDLPVLKTEKAMKEQKKKVLEGFIPYFSKVKTNRILSKQDFENRFDSLWVRDYGFDQSADYEFVKKESYTLYKDIFKKGYIDIPQGFKKKYSSKVIRLVDGNKATEKYLDEFFSKKSIEELLQQKGNYLGYYRNFVQSILFKFLKPNIVFNSKMTQSEEQLRVENISPFGDVVLNGQLIISKGEVVTEKSFAILESLRLANVKDDTKSYTLILIGQIILVAIPLFAFMLFLLYFRADLFDENKNNILLLFLITLMVLLSKIAINFGANYLYIVPLIINVLIVRSFYDTRLALMTHLTTVLLVSYFVPNSFQFLFLQVITGMISIISIVKLYTRSQFFVTSIYIFLSYAIMYVAMIFITQGNFKDIDLLQIGFFGINSFLVLFSFPLIFILEKTFRLISDISLLEYADTNNKVLRELASKAPGTFQHSVQVANLAEEAIREVGGNPLLVRAGAMYHDIGKSLNPSFFTENQVGNYNPHEDLSFEESAAIILDHVISGVELARKYNIPEQIIGFIRTHHGTKTVEYFYRMSLKDKPIDEVDLEDFTYKGPIPYSLETCILMMADAVEAASRSIKDPDSKKISNLVDLIIKSQMDSGQYNNANITFKDITLIKKLFKRKLMSMYHVRIEYPD